MIKSFKCKETKLIYEEGFSKKFPKSIQKNAIIKLVMLDSIEKIEELQVPPSNHLEKLLGKRTGQYSIRINNKFRLCFKWVNNNAFDVEIVDYH
ncbi:MAG: type II toxin-antitoxin system RelE/ParE family toxin [Leptospirales bacterium]|nr:type II toxin-antitoxin system RelE/ParE family toxin [Leptospirales bacterium]